MVLKFAQRQDPVDSGYAFLFNRLIEYEVVASCPGCKTMETLNIQNGRIIQTRKFKQIGKQVFHDCGAEQPCSIYRTRSALW